jgi:hypothetical protein
MSRTRKTIAKKFVRAGHAYVAGMRTHRWMRRAVFVAPSRLSDFA